MNRLIVSAWLLMLFQPVGVIPFEAVFCAPELFGCGDSRMLTDAPPIGQVSSKMGTWVIVGRPVGPNFEGFMLQVAGRPVGDYAEFGAPYTFYNPIPFGVRYRKGDRFSGWIDFRTHKRPFCGAPSLDNMPSCKAFY